MKGGMFPLGHFHGTLELSSDLIRKKVNSRALFSSQSPYSVLAQYSTFYTEDSLRSILSRLIMYLSFVCV